MNSGFDPYREWLGITSDRRPPNYYELLGVKIFEDRPSVIDAASLKRVELLQDIATGSERVEISQRILNEVSSARLCLLDENKRERYDLALRKERLGMDSAEEKIAKLASRAAAQAAPDSAQAPIINLAASHATEAEKPTFKPPVAPAKPRPVRRKGTKKKANSNWVLAIAALILLFSLIIAVLAVAVIFVSSSLETEQKPGTHGAADVRSDFGPVEDFQGLTDQKIARISGELCLPWSQSTMDV